MLLLEEFHKEKFEKEKADKVNIDKLKNGHNNIKEEQAKSEEKVGRLRQSGWGIRAISGDEIDLDRNLTKGTRFRKGSKKLELSLMKQKKK